MHAYMHTCIHAYMHTCIHADMQTCRHAYMHTCIHAYMHPCIHAYMHTCIHAYMHTCIHASMHTCIHAYMHTCIHASMHPSIHPSMHACIHTLYGYTLYIDRPCIHTLCSPLLVNVLCRIWCFAGRACRQVLIQAARALEYLATFGLIHRDFRGCVETQHVTSMNFP